MIIVIGATSFIGVHTVTELVNQGEKVLVTGRKNRFKEHYDALGVEYVNLDLDNPEDFNKLPKVNVEGVILLAGLLPEKVLRYLNTLGTQLFSYTHDGSYTIDNSIAERFMCPLARECKNSLFFGSGKMASVSAAYHTTISTCKMQGIHVLKYLKEFFKQIVLGRIDYENLLPMTIGINNNKY